MGLNKVKAGSNMYQFITHTWNPIRGTCYHGCSYCYMHAMWNRFPEMRDLQFVEKEMETYLGKGKFIFIGSSTDMFSENISLIWIRSIIEKCMEYPENKYLFQSKNPDRFIEIVEDSNEETKEWFKEKTVFCTTIESNKWVNSVMGNSPHPVDRQQSMFLIRHDLNIETYVTVEPIMIFNKDNFAEMIRDCQPTQVNIGADSGKNNLPEPTSDEIRSLINDLEKFTKVKQKDNLKRLLK